MSASQTPPFADAGRTNPLDRRSLMLSLSIHVLALVFLIWGVPALAPEPIVYQAIEIRVVSAPPAPAPSP
ncbi:MAG: cell envelope integrity protein TolA, partial [Gemmatimonadetes bacterium]|nr:cell envelope integrity protein TolA [Gemmatimonadota bacterium]